MKYSFFKKLKLVSLLFVLLFCTTQTTFAQRSSQKNIREKTEKKKKNTPRDFRDRVYVGGYLNSPFFGGGGGVNRFSFGLSPFAGYEINDILSVGPLFKVDYLYYQDFNGRSSTWDLGALGFVRATFFDRLFLQLEGGIYSYQYYVNNQTFEKDRLSVPVSNLGIGWSFQGGNLRQELMLSYEITNNLADLGIIPFDYRLGFRIFF